MKTLLLVAVGAIMMHIAAASKDCSSAIKVWDQCGGKSNCKGGDCEGPWTGQCCAAGSSCIRNNEWYYNCQPDSTGSFAHTSNVNNAPQQQQQQQQPARVAAPAPAPAVTAKKTAGGGYDYGQVLGLSMMFYEAQRSGKMPANNRIAWRGDSGLNDRAPDGRDVTGGWYDAGDNVKFNLPMAWSAGVLAWSVVEFPQGYKKAGQYQTALANIKWATDYFIKCIGDGKTIVAQVGNGQQDHAIWGRPEDVKGPVPVYIVTPAAPGSDVVGAMGGALAAASEVFKVVDPAYSNKLLAAAIKAYEFASEYPGNYATSVPDAASFYRSNNYMDDIAWNAAWLFVRTGNVLYRDAALSWFMRHWQQEDGAGVWDNYDWDSNSWGAVVLLNRFFPSNAAFQARIDGFISAWTKGSDLVQFTPKGLAFSGPWGSLRHAGNAIFLLKAYAAKADSKALSPAARREIDCAVKQQLGYVLGDTGRSFVVGYGVNPPQQPHHRGSSCPALGTECSWDAFNSPSPNPHTLFGAVVGGPGAADDYVDARNDFMKNEVATDYNAGFSGALAAAQQGLSCPAGPRRMMA